MMGRWMEVGVHMGIGIKPTIVGRAGMFGNTSRTDNP